MFYIVFGVYFSWTEKVLNYMFKELNIYMKAFKSRNFVSEIGAPKCIIDY